MKFRRIIIAGASAVLMASTHSALADTVADTRSSDSRAEEMQAGKSVGSEEQAQQESHKANQQQEMRGRMGEKSSPSPDTVKQVQRQLNDSINASLTVDGQMGEQTHQALRRFQQQNQLPATGELDAQTAEKLGVSKEQ